MVRKIAESVVTAVSSSVLTPSRQRLIGGLDCECVSIMFFADCYDLKLFRAHPFADFKRIFLAEREVLENTKSNVKTGTYCGNAGRRMWFPERSLKAGPGMTALGWLTRDLPDLAVIRDTPLVREGTVADSDPDSLTHSFINSCLIDFSIRTVGFLSTPSGTQ